MISVPCDNTHWAPHCFHCWVLCDWVSLAFGETPDLLAQRSWALIPALALSSTENLANSKNMRNIKQLCVLCMKSKCHLKILLNIAIVESHFGAPGVPAADHHPSSSVPEPWPGFGPNGRYPVAAWSSKQCQLCQRRF